MSVGILLRRGFVASSVLGGVGVGAYAYKEPGFQREVAFWGRAAPIVAHYFFAVSSFSPFVYFTNRTPKERTTKINELNAKYASSVLDIILDLKGLYIKLGQVCSVQAEFVPKEFRKELRVLQSEVPGRPFEEIGPVIEAELGGEISDYYSWFDPEPCGAASIGQAHRACVKDTGEDVVVKVQYPEAPWMVTADLRCIGDLIKIGVFAGAFDGDSAMLQFHEFSRQFSSELDYEQERRNLEDVQECAERFKDKVVIPNVVPRLCTGKIITMTYLPGGKLEQEARRQLEVMGVDLEQGVQELLQMHLEAQEAVFTESQESMEAVKNKVPQSMKVVSWVVGPGIGLAIVSTAGRLVAATRTCFASVIQWAAYCGLASESWRDWAVRQHRAAYNAAGTGESQTEQWLDTLFEVHGYQIFCGKLFNADPHPGNVLVLPDNRLGLIDYGQCQRLSHQRRKQVAQLIVAVVEEKSDVEIAETFWEMGIRTRNHSPRFMANFGRMLFGQLASHHLTPEWHLDMLLEDQVTVFPSDIGMVCRVAGLLRGLALALQVNVNVSTKWAKYAKEILDDDKSSVGFSLR
eukprot:m.342407 g.342407  ORF g.342407 m.342407 type:complete len:576 (-) comp21351_c0_seq1:128-1855(-)